MSGRYINIADPEPSSIVITDIAWSLSRQGRFAGHTLSEENWSVAQHSVFVLELIRLALDEHGDGVQLHDSLNHWLINQGFMEDQFMSMAGDTRLYLGGLLHDATEAYLVDLPSPVKRQNGLREPYLALEAQMMNAIETSLGLQPLQGSLGGHIIRWGDLLALRIEAANLMPSRGRGWNGLPNMGVDDISLFPKKVLGWREARDQFLYEYESLRECV